MSDIDTIFNRIVEKHKYHTYSVSKDESQNVKNAAMMRKRLMRRRDLSDISKMQICILEYLCRFKIKRGYQDEFSIFHNIVFEDPDSDIRKLALIAVKNNKFLPQELELLRNMKNMIWNEYYSMITREMKDNTLGNDMIMLEKVLIDKLGRRVSKKKSKNVINNMTIVT